MNIIAELDKLYKEWSGVSHLENSNKFVHDSADAQDFARYCIDQLLSDRITRICEEIGIEHSLADTLVEKIEEYFTPPTEDKDGLCGDNSSVAGRAGYKDHTPPDTSIFGKVELSVSEMCGISIHELKSGRKYGQIPTAKQLIVRVLYELKYKPATILENMPYMSTIQSIRSRYYASIKYEKYDKRFRIVLEQLKDIYLK